MPQKSLRELDLEQLNEGRFTRSFRLERGSVDTERRTAEMSFSSEEPYERWWGIEILDHGPNSVRLGRLNGGGHPLLVQHDPDRQAGVIEKAWIGEDRKGRSVARFGRSAYADEIFQDVNDGIRTLVSVGYIIHAIVEESTSKSGEAIQRQLTWDEFRALVTSDEFKRSVDDRRAQDDDLPVYRVMDWEPLENSLVAVPADATVGVGRSKGDPQSTRNQIKEAIVPEDKKPDPAPPDITGATNEARTAETARVREILAMGDHYSLREQAAKAVNEGSSVDAFRKLVLEDLKAKAPARATERNLGLSDQEVQRFSISRAIRALVTKDWKDAGFERDCHQATEKRLGEAKHDGVLIPPDVLQRLMLPINRRAMYREDPMGALALEREILQRDLTVGVASAGGNLVQTSNLAGSFIELLRARARVVQLGAIVLPGLRDSITIPKQTGAGSFFWLATEATAITEGNQTFGQVALSPKNGGAYTELSMQLLKQSNPAADMIVMTDLGKVCALAVDLAALNGSGAAGQPLGVIGTSGIGAVTGAALAWLGVVEFESDVSTANADVETMAYLTTPAVRGLLKAREKAASTGNFIWGGVLGDNRVNGYRGEVSTQVPAANMLFGDFSQIVIGEWGALEISMNPYANFPAGIVGIRAWVTVDVGVRQAGAFSLATGIT